MREKKKVKIKNKETCEGKKNKIKADQHLKKKKEEQQPPPWAHYMLGPEKTVSKVYTWPFSLEWICLGDRSASLQLLCILCWKLPSHSDLL